MISQVLWFIHKVWIYFSIVICEISLVMTINHFVSSLYAGWFIGITSRQLSVLEPSFGFLFVNSGNSQNSIPSLYCSFCSRSWRNELVVVMLGTQDNWQLSPNCKCLNDAEPTLLPKLPYEGFSTTKISRKQGFHPNVLGCTPQFLHDCLYFMLGVPAPFLETLWLQLLWEHL